MSIYQQLLNVVDLLLYLFLVALLAAFLIGLTLGYSLPTPKKKRRQFTRELVNGLLKAVHRKRH